ncbi:ComEC family competence protein [Roseomonas eburnea]|uniref:ComEC family competence protein n=1 Tax=Neoroseomonas eburnea TaxID=1346889 RepID=A0A9X9XFF7_9PROT|nr:ComEC/Rec2 family competence protein [Neoroseomonas eburnea]MBR0682443.1 ComEC family competence protein [Neoroseomonas eburnea]
MRNQDLSSTVARESPFRPGTALGAAALRVEVLLAGERGRLAPWLAVAMGAGVLAYFGLREEPSPWVMAPAPVLVVLAWWVATRAPHAGWGLGLVAAAALGFAAAVGHAWLAPPALAPPMRAVVLSGVVLDADLLPEGRRVTLGEPRFGPEGPPQPRTIRVRLRANDPARPEPGDRLSVRALVRAPSAPAYPGAWDFQRAAFFAGQGGAGFAIGPAEVAAGEGRAPPLSGLRAEIEARVTAVLPGPAGAVAAALLTGGQSAIPRDDLAAMRDSGLAHLLSVSGLHIAIVMGVTFWVVRFLIACWRWLALRVDGKVWAGVVALTAGGFYLLLTGSQVPMQRSFAMAVLVTIALLTGRQVVSLRSLALAAAAVMLVSPDAVLGPSFQMSFAAVLALIAGWEAMKGPMARLRGDGAWWRRVLVFAGGLVGTSVLAGAATAPFGLAHFGRLQWYGVAANAVAVPLTSVLAMPAGMAAALLMPLGLDAPALAVMGWGVEGVLAVAREVASWPGAAQGARPIPPWGLGVLAFGMVWLCLWRLRWRLLGLPLMALGLASPTLHRAPDLFVSGDARLIGFAAEGVLWLQRQSGASSLTRDAWLRAHGIAEPRPLPMDGEAARGAIACDAGACVLRAVPGGPEAVLLRRAPFAEYCGRAVVVVSAEPVRGRCAGSAVVDRFAVWRNGPHAVWLGSGGARIVSDRAWRGARPWVPPVPVPRGREDLPLAPVE